MSPTLGVDPGVSGAAVLLAEDGRTVLGAWSWTQRKRKGGTVYVLDGAWVAVYPDIAPPSAEGAICAGLATVGNTIRSWALEAAPAWHLAVEALFVGAHTNGMIELAESAGIMLGILEGIDQPTRRRASQWRPAMGCPSSPALVAEQAAIGIAARRLDWLAGAWWDDLRGRGHVAEAALIAQDAATQRRAGR